MSSSDTPEQHRKLDQFDKIKIKTSSGMVPIENFVNWAPQAKIGIIKRVNTQRTRTIKSDVDAGMLPNKMVEDIKSWLNESNLPETVTVKFKGEDEEQQKAKSFLVKAFSVALFIMAVVLVTQFNSFYSSFSNSICSRYVNDRCFNWSVNYRQTLWSCYDRGRRNSIGWYCG